MSYNFVITENFIDENDWYLLSILDPSPYLCVETAESDYCFLFPLFCFGGLHLYAHALHVQDRLMNMMVVFWDYHLT
jgi:hypothetical protein